MSFSRQKSGWKKGVEVDGFSHCEIAACDKALIFSQGIKIAKDQKDSSLW